jgi:hypothetical protein
MPRLVPVHPLRPVDVAREGHHSGGGGARAGHGDVPSGDRGRARVRGEDPPGVPDPGRVHAVGHPAAAGPVPGPRPGPGPHVLLRRHRAGAPPRVPGPVHRGAAVHVLQGRRRAGHRAPGLLDVLGLARGEHPAVGAVPAGGGAREPACRVARQAALPVLEGQPWRRPRAPGLHALQRQQRHPRRVPEGACIQAGLGIG